MDTREYDRCCQRRTGNDQNQGLPLQTRHVAIGVPKALRGTVSRPAPALVGPVKNADNNLTLCHYRLAWQPHRHSSGRASPYVSGMWMTIVCSAVTPMPAARAIGSTSRPMLHV